MQTINSLLEFLKTVAIIVIIAFFVRFYLIQPFVVEGSSMEPNFHSGEYLLVDKVSYRFRDIKRGEVIVFHPPSRPNLNYIKRIIALPGDNVQIKDGEISVNGARLDEPYISGGETLIRNSFAANLTQKLGRDEYFVLGDNRDHSSDSREIGAVPRHNIVGRAWLVVFPIRYFGLVLNPRYAAIPEFAIINYLN